MTTDALTSTTAPEPLPPVETMSERELLCELVTNIRVLRATLDPIIENPAAILANMGPMAGIFAGMFAGKRS